MAPELKTLKPHDHPCLIYETKEEQIAAFVPYLRSGLAQGEKCLYIVDESTPEWVMEALGADNFPINDFVDSGAFSIITTGDAYLKDGYFDTPKMVEFWAERIKEANAAGFTALRAAAEMSWALTKEPGCEQLVAYESHLNCVFPEAKVSALCQYNRKRFTAQVVKDMIHVHPLVVVGNELIENPGFIKPEEFIESHAEMDVQALVDNLLMTKRLSQANQSLRDALAAQQRAQAAIEERQREYENLYQELLSLAKVVSHELQAPITVMQSYLRLLSARYRTQLGADADEFIDKSLSASSVVARMIDDLWNYARVDSPAETVVEDIDTTDLIGKVLRELAPTIEQTQAVIEHDASLPKLMASRRHLEFLFKEVIGNALKHRQAGLRPSVYVGSKQGETECTFWVSDNGRGIDSVHSLDVFKLFNRLNDTADETGTGMGLAICKRIVQYYDGKIWFESHPGSKTTFYISLPNEPEVASNITSITHFIAKSKRAEHLA